MKIKKVSFAGLQDELKKVTWPTRKQTLESTVTVIVISLIVAVFVGIIDFSLVRLLELISQRAS